MKSDMSGDSASVISRGDKHVSGETKTTVMTQERVSQETRVKTATAETQTGVFDDPAVNRLYTPISVAKEEIWKRWNNEDLKKEVEKFLGNDIPECLQNGPKAVLGRCIASPNREAVHFLRIAEQLDLPPLFMEYLSDKFVAANFDKYYLGKLFFYNGKGRCNGDNITTKKIIKEIDGGDGHPIRGIKTKWGNDFADFHHKMLCEITSKQHGYFDMSLWFATHGGSAKLYYPYYLALFICHGVYAELFLLYTQEDRVFFEDIVRPAIALLEKTFGVLPLITPVSPVYLGADISWKHYPEFMKKLIPDSVLA